jgi:hypothetical protein
VKNYQNLACALGGMAMGLASAMPLGAWAQAAATVAVAVADPKADVPAVVYESVFRQSPTGVETQSVDWKKANADVAQFPRGHVDILKWEEAQIKGQQMAKPVGQNAPSPAGAGLGRTAVHGQSVTPATVSPPAVHKH